MHRLAVLCSVVLYQLIATCGINVWGILTVLQKLSSHLPAYTHVASDHAPCTICPLSKRRRLAYVSHNKLSQSLFD
ncbi:unnamed protein product [Brassica napus]|uniref:(rape) hypothetical protein n=1 Tax=Brassica napus TaxID=3708 RepID=A0A816J3V6_BRANA|nr:unnamed protein product [Brassica napus]